MSSLPKEPGQQLDWLTDYINSNMETLKPETVVSIVLKMTAARIQLMRIQNGGDEEVDFEKLQRELGA